MEVRCGSCNKLFRVSDDKITGKGIKFACTRCNNSVKITKEEYDQHVLAQSTVSALDMFIPKPKPAKSQAPEPVSEPQPVPQPISEPEYVQEAAEVITPEQEPAYEATPAEAAEDEPSVEDVFNSAEFTSLLRPSDPEPEADFVSAPPETDSLPLQKPEPAPRIQKEPDTGTVAAGKPAPVSVPVSSPKKEQTSYEPRPSSEKGSTPSHQPVSTGRRFLVPLIIVVLIGAAAAAATLYLRESFKTGADKAVAPIQEPRKLISPVGLQVTRAAGNMDVNGDLTITGVVENTADKDCPAWYVVADVYDAQGTTLIQARLLNGIQLYTQRDFDFMSQRGVNVQELKAKSLQEPGVIIPARGVVNFEIHIMEPPAGSVSFNALLQSFDPVLVYKETSESKKLP